MTVEIIIEIDNVLFEALHERAKEKEINVSEEIVEIIKSYFVYNTGELI